MRPPTVGPVAADLASADAGGVLGSGGDRVGDLLALDGALASQASREIRRLKNTQPSSRTDLDEFEGDPRRRPLTVDELEAFFAAGEARIQRCCSRGRKGVLQAWRDDAMFKVKFAWGLRRGELCALDVVDFRRHPKLPEFRAFGQVHVRGKAKRGGGPRRRTVLSVFDWSVDVIEQYLTEVRPAFGCVGHPAVFVTERGTRLWLPYVNERFAEIRAEAGLDPMLTPHCLRHSYVTHLAELGWAAKFIQDQVGHSHAATTAIYMSVGDDFKDRLVRAAVDEQLAELGGGG